MSICEDDLPLSELVSPCHHCLDPREFIALLPKPKRDKSLPPPAYLAQQHDPEISLDDYLDELVKEERRKQKWATYMRSYRAQHP